MKILGLDLGTTNVKAVVTDRQGTVLGRGSVPISMSHPGAGGAEQDIEEIWSATQQALSRALAPVDRADVQALGISAQGGALQLLDANHRPLGPVISWLDQRGLLDDSALTDELGHDWFRTRIGHGCCGLALGQLLRLQRERPDWRRAPNRVGFVGDVIVQRLCGTATHDATSAGLTLLLNPRLGCYDPDLLARLGLRGEQLPALLSPRQAAGGLAGEVARALGLRPGLPVSPAIHDQYAAALGTQATSPGDVMVGAGTAWVLLATTAAPPPLVFDHAFVCTHVVTGLHGEILSLVNGGSALSWALKLMGCETAGGEVIETLLAAAPPGCDGLVFWPFMTPFGASGLEPGTRGRLSGLQLAHTPAHVARSVVEGLAFELERHRRLLLAAGLPVTRLVLGGRVAVSPTTPRILADVTGVPIDCVTGAEGSVLGAAVIGRGLIEPDRSLADLSRDMVPSPERIQPGEHARFYQERFAHYASTLPLLGARACSPQHRT
jgi:sugar (pentulose or hexulose) kinase